MPDTHPVDRTSTVARYQFGHWHASRDQQEACDSRGESGREPPMCRRRASCLCICAPACHPLAGIARWGWQGCGTACRGLDCRLLRVERAEGPVRRIGRVAMRTTRARKGWLPRLRGELPAVWLQDLIARRGYNRAAVALANKNASVLQHLRDQSAAHLKVRSPRLNVC